MKIKLALASIEDKNTIENLMQFYMYDFSEYMNSDVEEDGLFAAYPHLNMYWSEENRFPYSVIINEKYVGFVLVRFIGSINRTYFSIAEFFIMRRYRRQGIGKAVAQQIFDLHKGPWEVFQKESNKPAQIFWNKVINEYTKGHFEDRFESGRRIQGFES